MSIANLKLDDLPEVHAAYIFPTDSDYGSDPIKLGDARCAKISKGLKQSEGKDLSSLAKEYKNKALRTKKSFEIDNETFELYVLYGSSDDIAVFLIEGETLFSKSLNLKEEKDNSLLILPFLDGALMKFLERSEIYGTDINYSNTKRRNMHKSGRSMRILQVRETFSLEEVFRDLDVDGNGNIDLDEWKHGLTQMMGDSSISEEDMELVFKEICHPSDNISWRQFYSFFDGKKLTNSRRNRTLSTGLVLTPNFASSKHLGTLNENEQEEDGVLDNAKISNGGDDKKEETEQEHIAKVKNTIRECLNLGEDHATLSTPFASTPSSDAGSTFGSHLSLRNIPSNTSSTGVDVDNMDISKSLVRLEYCEELLELMESQLYQIPNLDLMTKWENRYQNHKLRINNFRKILNGMLSNKMISMKDELRTLATQLEAYTNGEDGGYDATMNSLQGMADLHSQQMGSLTSLTSPKKKGKLNRGKSGRHKTKPSRSGSHSSTYSSASDDDTSSVDSEVNLVYTKGTKLSSKESETLINRVKLQKKEIKKLSKQIKKIKEDHKLEVVKMKTLIDTQRTKLKSYEKARQSMVVKQQKVKEQMRSLGKGKKKKENIEASKAQNAGAQREISVLRKQLKNLTNELEAEQERKRNLQKKLTRVLSSGKGDKGNKENSTVSMNKLKRLEKEKERLEQEITAKTKKNEDMFLKMSKYQRDYGVLEAKNGELEARLGSYTTQIKEINKRTMELQQVTEDRDRALADVEALEKKMIKLNEKISKLKSRNRKMKDRIKNLLLTIEEYDKLASQSRKLIKELSDLQNQLSSVETESAKYKNENQSLNDKIAELKAKIAAKKNELNSTTTKLEKFKDDLSAEYTVINKLQEELEQKDQEMNEKEEQYKAEIDQTLSQQEILENEKDELNLQLIRSKAQLEQSQKAINRYKEKCEKYEKQIEEMNEKLINYEQNQMMKLNSSISDLKSKLAGKDDEIKLLAQKNESLQEQLANAKDVSDAIKEKNDEIDDLMNKIVEWEAKFNKKRDDFKNKCNEYDELNAKFKKLQKDQEQDKAKIGKLNIRIKEYQSKKMQEDDEVKLKLKQYNTVLITVEENKKLIEKLRNQVGEFKTKWQLEKEALERHKKATKTLEEEASEKSALIKSQKKKIKQLQKELDTSGYGDSKQKSTLSLLRQNVETLEQNGRTKDFEIKKLKNQMKAMGMNDVGSGGGGKGGGSDALKKKVSELEKSNEQLTRKLEKQKAKNKTDKEALAINKDLLSSKNDEISKLKIEVSELKENESRMLDEQKENEQLNKTLAETKNETNEQVEKLNDKVQELQQELEKVRTEKQRKIDALESDLAEKDNVLLQISKTYGTEFHNSEEI